MARRKRKEEEAIWKPPEFDEVGYMRQEIQNAKIATVVILWAVAGAVLAYLIALWVPVVGYLAGLAAFGALYFLLPVLGLPIHGFKRRDWMGHASIYFFSWLAFSIILLNAPFGDHTAPVVGSFEAGSFNPGGNLTAPAANSTSCRSVANGATAALTIGANQTLYILFRATDNVQVASVQVQVNQVNATPVNVAGQPNACTAWPLRPAYLPDTYAILVPAKTTTTFLVTVTAVDTSHLTTTATITVSTA